MAGPPDKKRNAAYAPCEGCLDCPRASPVLATFLEEMRTDAHRPGAPSPAGSRSRPSQETRRHTLTPLAKAFAAARTLCVVTKPPHRKATLRTASGELDKRWDRKRRESAPQIHRARPHLQPASPTLDGPLTELQASTSKLQGKRDGTGMAEGCGMDAAENSRRSLTVGSCSLANVMSCGLETTVPFEQGFFITPSSDDPWMFSIRRSESGGRRLRSRWPLRFILKS